MEKSLQEINEKLHGLTNRLDNFMELEKIHQKHVTEIIQRHDRLLYGDNGKTPGLNVRVDRIETSAKVISKISWSGLMAGVGALGMFMLGLFSWRE